MIDAVIDALGMALAMGWEILWPLILGFAPSAVVQAAVSKQHVGVDAATAKHAAVGVTPSGRSRVR